MSEPKDYNIDEILDKLLEDIVDANFNGYNYALVKPAKDQLYQLILEVIGEGRQLLIYSDDQEYWNGGYVSVSEQKERLNNLFGKDKWCTKIDFYVNG